MKRMSSAISWAAAGASILALASGGSAAAGTTHALQHPGPVVRVVNLHGAYETRLGRTKAAPIFGVVYARGKQPKAPSASCTEPACPLVYNGGSVQHTPHVFLLLWGPDWSTVPGQETSASYLVSFYKGLGVQPQDDWSVTTAQYSDGTGHPSFNGSVFAGVWNDTSIPPYGADQTQIAAEADAFAAKNKIYDLTDAQIVVATQSGTCPAGFDAPGCGGTGTYCAWHSSSNEPYTNLPYMPDAGSACGEDSVNPNGSYDGFSLVGGQEYAGSITDPFPPTGWQDLDDPSGGEIGDKCAGSPLTGDISLSTGIFAMQPLWSNDAGGCVMSTTDDVTVNNPGNQATYQESKLSLQVTGVSGGNFYPLQWSATRLPAGLTISSSSGVISGQVAAAPGVYNVTISATDQTGTSGSANFTWTVDADTGTTITNLGAGLCLNDNNYQITPGSKVVMWACNTAANEQWTHTAKNGELVVLGQCLTFPANGGIGTSPVIEPCTGRNSQLWFLNSKHEYVLQQNFWCLTDPSGSTVNGTQVDLGTCTHAKYQQWQN